MPEFQAGLRKSELGKEVPEKVSDVFPSQIAPLSTPSKLSQESLSGIAGNTPNNRRRSPSPLRISRFQAILTGVQLSADIITIFLSFSCGYFTWIFLGPMIFPMSFQPVEFGQLYFSLGIGLISCLIGFEVNGLYHPHRSILNMREFEGILKTCVIACAISLSILFLAQGQFFNRGIFIIAWCCMLAFMLIQRYLFFRFQSFLRMCGFAETTALIYGAGVVGSRLLDKLQQSPKLGYHVVGFIDDDAVLQGKSISSTPVLGSFSDLKSTIQNTRAKKLFVALPHIPQKLTEEIFGICKSAGCEVFIVPYLYDIVIQRVKLSEVDGIPLIGMTEPRYSLRTMIAKRIFDLLGSVVLLILLSPIFILIAAGIKFTSDGGPVFFKQKRVGKYGRKFTFFKFRSMYVNAPVYAQTPQSAMDQRIFPFGRFLRRTSLDELPQLYNVLKGDMSLVGPRPEMPFIVDKYNDLQRQRLNVRPGITGVWQISADRRLAIHENMDYDIYYINHQSLLLDMVILIRTAFSVLKGIGAY